MGHDPLEQIDEIKELRVWMMGAGINRLRDLSVWDHRGEWAGCDLHDAPGWLSMQRNQLIELLEELTPENWYIKDSWAWGQTGVYTTAAGYKTLQELRNNNHNPTFWKQVWDNLALLKVIFFFWTLMHNKILTSDNLEKRNIAGPHRCTLCISSKETTQHLFMECHYAKETWGLILQGLQIPSFPQCSVVNLFADWNNQYPQSIPIKSFQNKVWIAIPKFVYWQIWLARNDQIFNGHHLPPLQVAAKAKAFLLEAAQQQFHKEDPLLLPEERRWLHPLEPAPRKSPLTPQTTNPEWRRRDSEDAFSIWWRSKKLTTIFFDGASKGNPGTAGAGGIIYSTDGTLKDCFSWSLSQESNNQAEIYGLLKACQIARDQGVKQLQVFGDSEILIKKLNTEDPFSNAALNKTWAD